jgi:hypothetical protein
MKSARDTFGTNVADREAWDRLHVTSFLIVVAAHQVLAYARSVLGLASDDELADAIRNAETAYRDLDGLRDVIAHMDDYAVGEGHRQTGKRNPRLADQYPSAFISWSDGGTYLALADFQVNLRRATDAATRLAGVVEVVRARQLELAEREANEELRQRYGLPAE